MLSVRSQEHEGRPLLETKGTRAYNEVFYEETRFLAPAIAGLYQELFISQTEGDKITDDVRQLLAKSVAARLALETVAAAAPAHVRLGQKTGFQVTLDEFVQSHAPRQLLEVAEATAEYAQIAFSELVRVLGETQPMPYSPPQTESAFAVFFNLGLEMTREKLAQTHDWHSTELLLGELARTGDTALLEKAANLFASWVFTEQPNDQFTFSSSKERESAWLRNFSSFGPVGLMIENSGIHVRIGDKAHSIKHIAHSLEQELHHEFVLNGEKAAWKDLSLTQRHSLAVLAAHNEGGTEEQIRVLMRDPSLVEVLNDLPYSLQNRFASWKTASQLAYYVAKFADTYALSKTGISRFTDETLDFIGKHPLTVAGFLLLGGMTTLAACGFAGTPATPDAFTPHAQPTGTLAFTPLPTDLPTATVTAVTNNQDPWHISHLPQVSGLVPFGELSQYGSDFQTVYGPGIAEINLFIANNPDLCVGSCQIFRNDTGRPQFLISINAADGTFIYLLRFQDGVNTPAMFDFQNSEIFKNILLGSQIVLATDYFVDPDTQIPRTPLTDEERNSSISRPLLIDRKGNILAELQGDPFDGGAGKWRIRSEKALGLQHIDGYAFIVFLNDTGDIAYGGYYQISEAPENKGVVLLGVPPLGGIFEFNDGQWRPRPTPIPVAPPTGTPEPPTSPPTSTEPAPPLTQAVSTPQPQQATSTELASSIPTATFEATSVPTSPPQDKTPAPAGLGLCRDKDEPLPFAQPFTLDNPPPNDVAHRTPCRYTGNIYVAGEFKTAAELYSALGSFREIQGGVNAILYGKVININGNRITLSLPSEGQDNFIGPPWIGTMYGQVEFTINTGDIRIGGAVQKGFGPDYSERTGTLGDIGIGDYIGVVGNKEGIRNRDENTLVSIRGRQ